LTAHYPACKEFFTGRIVILENRLKAMREGRGWSQGELARRLGVSRQTINAVETDKYDPSLPLALRMAKLFGVAVPELFVDHWEPEEE
jgi:putative transcriptional regulator